MAGHEAKVGRERGENYRCNWKGMRGREMQQWEEQWLKRAKNGCLKNMRLLPRPRSRERTAIRQKQMCTHTLPGSIYLLAACGRDLMQCDVRPTKPKVFFSLHLCLRFAEGRKEGDQMRWCAFLVRVPPPPAAASSLPLLPSSGGDRLDRGRPSA